MPRLAFSLPAVLAPFPAVGTYPPAGIVAAEWIAKRAADLGLTVKRTGRQKLIVSSRPADWWDDRQVLAGLAAEIERMNFFFVRPPIHVISAEIRFGSDAFYPEPPPQNRRAADAANAAFRAKMDAWISAAAAEEETRLQEWDRKWGGR